MGDLPEEVPGGEEAPEPLHPAVTLVVLLATAAVVAVLLLAAGHVVHL
ncbi:MAG: hypothetical protein ACRDY3_13570 [Acidimicrobiales bacterium]